MNYNPKIGETFRPEPQFKTLYYIYLLLTLVFGVLTWFIPVMLFAPFVVTAFILLPIVIIVVFAIYWIPRYYNTIQYTLTEDEIVWQRGVWFKKTGIVPYNRITNVDVSQGPVSRMLGIAFLKIQTALSPGAFNVIVVKPAKFVGVIVIALVPDVDVFKISPEKFSQFNQSQCNS